MKPCESSVISLQLGSSSNRVASSLWDLRFAALEHDHSLRSKYFYQYDDNSAPKPKTIFVDSTGEFSNTPLDAADEQDQLPWTGNTKIIHQAQPVPVNR